MVGWPSVYLPIWKYLDKNIIGLNPFHVHLVNENSQTLSHLPKTTFRICSHIYSTYFYYMPSIFIQIPIPNNNSFGEGKKINTRTLPLHFLNFSPIIILPHFTSTHPTLEWTQLTLRLVTFPLSILLILCPLCSLKRSFHNAFIRLNK